MSIRPIPDLRNYPNVLEDVAYRKPVSLTKNGRVAYVILQEVEFEEFNVMRSQLELFTKLNRAKSSNEFVEEDAMFKTIMEHHQ